MLKQPSKTAITNNLTDLEDPIDNYFYRDTTSQLTFLAGRFSIKPNAFFIVSIFAGLFTGFLFYTPDFFANVIGMLLMILANSLRLTGEELAHSIDNKSESGRMLGELAYYSCFFTIYFAIVLRSINQDWGSILVCVAGISAAFWHFAQRSIACYYRSIHLYFMNYAKDGEVENSFQIKEKIESIPQRGHLLKRIILYIRYVYIRSLEKVTPDFQKLITKIRLTYLDGELPASLCETFRAQSKPLMKYTNILQFNVRVMALLVFLFLNRPIYYFLFSLIVMSSILFYLVEKHEKMSRNLFKQISN